jgi:hypothetical protein
VRILARLQHHRLESLGAQFAREFDDLFWRHSVPSDIGVGSPQAAVVAVARADVGELDQRADLDRITAAVAANRVSGIGQETYVGTGVQV